MAMGKEDMAAFRDMARSFAKRSIAPILEHDSPDGDLSRVPEVLDQAFETGLLSSPLPDAPGHEAGIWGRSTLEEGPHSSLVLLQELSNACAGVAMNVHALGLASLVVSMAEKRPAQVPDRLAVALFENGFPPGPGTIMDPGAHGPAGIRTRAERDGAAYVISGSKEFVYMGHGSEGFVVFAMLGDDWSALLVPGDSQGLTVKDAGHRMGLRACPLVNVELDQMKVPADALLGFDRPMPEVVMEVLRLWWLGTLAIGSGVVRKALDSARQYAYERYQGGTEIINHPGVNALLLAEVEARALQCGTLVEMAAEGTGAAIESLLFAARSRLSGLASAASAVTDSLQVFGGYGYMEDYPMTKLYRDINTLKRAGGGPRDLEAMIAGLSMES